MNAASKIKSRSELVELRNELRKQKRTVVFTNGCFDLIHRGHVEYLEKASNLGDVLILGLNSDDSVRRLKGPGRPLLPQEDRAYILASLISVDYICIFDENTPLELITALTPDILVKGEDYRLKQIVGREVVEQNGGKVLTVPLTPGRSTTDIIQRIKKLVEDGVIK